MTSTQKLQLYIIISLKFLPMTFFRCSDRASASITSAGDLEEDMLRGDVDGDVLNLFQKGIWLKEVEYSTNLQRRIDSHGGSWGLSRAGDGADPRGYRSTENYVPKYFERSDTRFREIASTQGVGLWFIQVGSATLAVLSMSIDNVLLIAPFTIGPMKWFNIFVYFICVEAIGLAAWCLDSTADMMQKKHSDVNIDLICKTATSVMLTVFFVFLFREWLYKDLDESDIEDADDVTAPQGNAEDTLLSRTEEDITKIDSSTVLATKYTLSALIMIGLFGNLDNFALYIALLLDDAFSGLQLIIALAYGTMIIVLISMFATQFSCVVHFFEYLPLWVIIGILCIWCYVQVAVDL